MIIPFAEWRPDSPNVGDGYAQSVKNAIPQPGGYIPVEGLVQYSANALAAYCRGAYYLKNSSTSLIAGDETGLYLRTSTSFSATGKIIIVSTGTETLNSDGGGSYIENNGLRPFSKFIDGETITLSGTNFNDGTYTVNGTPTATKLYVVETWAVNEAAGTIASLTITKVYETAATGRWEFAQYEDYLIGTNFADYPQSINTVSQGTVDLTTDLKFRYCGVVKDFVVAGYTQDAVDGTKENRVRWCAQGDPTDWTVSASTLADYNDMVGPGGDVTGVVGGEYGVIFQEASISRMTFVGSPVVFQFDRVSDDVGCQVAGSIIKVGNTIYFLSGQGFMALDDGTALRPIGHGKIDRTFFVDFDPTGSHLMSAAEWPERSCIVWIYRSTAGSGNVCDKGLIYNYQTDQWSSLEQDLELVVTVPKTSPIKPSLAAFNTSHYLAFFEGSDLSAQLETTEFEPIPGARALLKSVSPIIRNSGGTLIIRYRDSQTEALSTATAGTILDATRRFGTRQSSRYFLLRWATVGDWNRAVGVDCEFSPRGRRG